MDLNIPKSRKLPNVGIFPGSTTVSEISVPTEDNIAWCIVLSYIISKDCKSCDDLSACLKVLTSKTIKEKNIGQAIKSFNPFRDSCSFFNVKSIKNVIRDFKTNIGWDNLNRSWEKLNAASVMLKCQIWVIYNDDTFDIITTPEECDNIIILFTSNNQETVEHGTRFSFAMRCDKKKTAALVHCMRKNKISKKNISKIKSAMKSDKNFLISLLKNASGGILLDLLKCRNILSKLRELGFETDPRCTDSNGFSAFYYAVKSCDSDICVDLLLFGMKFLELNFESVKSYREPNPEIDLYLHEVKEILKNDQDKCTLFELCENRETIEILFYSLHSLTDFLIGIAPNERDSLVQNSSQDNFISEKRDRILLILEKYSDFFDSLKYRDKEINLSNVSEYIKYKAYCDSIDVLTSLFFFDSIYCLKKLLSLNFELKLFINSPSDQLLLQDLCDEISKILVVKELSKHYIYTPEELELVCKDLYDSYLATPSCSSIDATHAFARGGKYFEAVKVFWEETKKPKEPSQCSSHYSKKEFKLIFRDLYAISESEFFVLVLSCVIFKKIEKSPILKTLHSYSDENLKILYEIPLKIRYNIQESTKVFREILNKTVIKHHIRKKQVVPIEEFHSLLNLYPCIRDHVNIERLKNYLNIPKNFRCFTKKSIFATERVLQVLGEFITLVPENEFCVTWFLSLYLPKNVGEILKNLRFKLSKFEAHTFRTKFNIEERIYYNTLIYLYSTSEYHLFTFKEVREEINNINNYLKPFFSVCNLRLSAYIFKNLKDILSKMNFPTEQFKVDQIIRHLFKNIPVASFKEYYSDIHAVFNVLLNHIDEENSKSSIEKMIEPLILITQWVYMVQKAEDEELLKSSKFCEVFYDKTQEDAVTDFLKKCRGFVETEPPEPFMQLKSTNYIEIFLEKLNHSLDLTYFEKCDIQNKIPQYILDFVGIKPAIVKHVKEGLPLADSLEKSNITGDGQSLLLKYFKSKSKDETLNMLNNSDPLQVLDEAFRTNSITFSMYSKICKVMQFKDDVRAKFSKLCCVGNKNIGVNKLALLYKRIQLIRNILIEQNSEISNLWIYDENEKHNQQYHKTIEYFLGNFEVRASIEMLFFDCMEIFGLKDYWLKTTKMYGGICLRNVVAHGNILLDNLCDLLDPNDLSSEIIDKCIELIRDEACVEAILQLYFYAGENFSKLQSIIKNNDTDEHERFRIMILSCNDKDGKNRYLELLRPNV